MPEINASTKTKYLEQDKSFNIQRHLNQLEKEEKSGLKGIEVRDKVKELGKDDFLKILLTQLSQQDPTNPMKDQEFIAQMAQFSSLEQMNNISSGISRMESKQSYSIVGKLVSGPDLVTGDDVVGIAGAIFFDGEGKTYARVNGRSIDVSKINLISDPNIMNEEQSAEKVMEPSTATQPKMQAQPQSELQSQPQTQSQSIDKIPGLNNPAVQSAPTNSMPGYSSGSIEENIPGYKPTNTRIAPGLKNNPYEDQVIIKNDER
ncbi:MAG: endoflagellar hook capping protein [Leptospira sp.]|nr:endoflagellar hook capping protein [Leptospira sp.]